MRFATSQSRSYPIVLTRLGGHRSRPIRFKSINDLIFNLNTTRVAIFIVDIFFEVIRFKINFNFYAQLTALSQITFEQCLHNFNFFFWIRILLLICRKSQQFPLSAFCIVLLFYLFIYAVIFLQLLKTLDRWNYSLFQTCIMLVVFVIFPFLFIRMEKAPQWGTS